MIALLSIFLSKLKGLLGKRNGESEFDDEMRAHLRLLTERCINQGMTPSQADSAARRQFGNTTSLRENRREIQTVASLEALWRDVRYGARQLRSDPLFTAIAVLSLALGIGANTAVFTLLDQILLRLLPVNEPERLVMIWTTGPSMGSDEGERASSYPMCQDFQRRADAFDFVFCRYRQQVAMRADGSTERANGELVSGNYFQALGVEPAIGRVFSPRADDRIYKGHPVVVLSHRYWARRFMADPTVVGRTIFVNNYPMEVVGVAAQGFTGLDPSRFADFWMSIQMKPLMTPGQDDLGSRRAAWVQIFARLKPGYSLASARAALQPLFHEILEQELGEAGLGRISQYDRARFLKRTAMVEPAAYGYSEMREQYSTALIMLIAMAGLILLIACANVASLLIARAAARQKEVAVRLAIGAGRRILIRQLMVESMLLWLIAAAVGVAVSVITTKVLLNMLPGGAATLALHAEPDARIFLFGIGVALTTGLLFGLTPALQGTRIDLAFALRNLAGAVAGTRDSARLRKMLVAAQVALSFLLLVGASLFVKTLLNLKNTPTGFRSVGNLIAFQVDPSKLGYTPPRIRAFYESALREIRSSPGVKSAAYSVVPVFQGNWWGWTVRVEGHQATDGEDMQAHANVISPGYFRTMGAPLLEGRDFDERDRFHDDDAERVPTVAIVNRKFAEHFFGKESPIGRHIGSGNPEAGLSVRIVGEVEDSLYEGLREGVPRQVFYAHLEALVPLRAYFYVRTKAEPTAMFPALRRIIARLDPSLPVDDWKTVEAQLDETRSTEKLIAMLSGVFGVLATVLAALGVYGVMGFVAARRTKEVGLRVALGAPQWSILWLVLREAVILVGAGLVAGVPATYLLSRYVSSELFGVKPTDAWAWLGSIAVLSLVGAVSGFVPARRASAVDPIAALRHE